MTSTSVLKARPQPQSPDKYPEPLVTPAHRLETDTSDPLSFLQLPGQVATRGGPQTYNGAPEFKTHSAGSILLKLGGENFLVEAGIKKDLEAARKPLNDLLTGFQVIELNLLSLIDPGIPVTKAIKALKAIAPALREFEKTVTEVHATLSPTLQPITQKMLNFVEAATQPGTHFDLSNPKPTGISWGDLLLTADAARIAGRLGIALMVGSTFGAGPLTYGTIIGAGIAVRLIMQESVFSRLILGRPIPARELPALREIQTLLSKEHRVAVGQFCQAGGHLEVLLTKAELLGEPEKTPKEDTIIAPALT